MDAQVQARIDAGDAAAARLRPLLGAIAIANARLAYQDYRDIFATPRWQQLAQQSRARPPRLLWASTGTKNPTYRDTLYVRLEDRPVRKECDSNLRLRCSSLH